MSDPRPPAPPEAPDPDLDAVFKRLLAALAQAKLPEEHHPECAVARGLLISCGGCGCRRLIERHNGAIEKALTAARSDVPALVAAVRQRDAEVARLTEERDAMRKRLACATRYLIRDVCGRRALLRLAGSEWIVSSTYEESGWYYNGANWVRWPATVPSWPTADAAFAALERARSSEREGGTP